MTLPFLGLLTICLLLATTAPICAGEIDFNRDVRPILADCCFECHGPDEESRVTEMRLDTAAGAVGDADSGAVIVPSEPENSELMERLLSDDEYVRMPPPESPRRPTQEQIETLRQWIAQGAQYDEHWAFVAPVRRPPPEITDMTWPRGEIDRFVLSYLEDKGLSPQPDAEATVLARRLSLAVTGLPASPEEMTRFTTAYENDPDAAIERFVDRLLASPAYGEHFAWMWMDAARYADTNGYQGDGERVMWPWRDWLIRTLNDNVPLDVMTEWMLAGDLLMPEPATGGLSEQRDRALVPSPSGSSPKKAPSEPHRTWESGDWIEDPAANELLLATGFLRNHRYDTGSGTIPEESIFENAADRMETVGTTWMGLTLQCARCHTHKFDPIENREYYQLLSFFDNVPEVGSALKGASHPYIHTPTPEQRQEVQRLLREHRHAQQAFAAACESLAPAQAEWERSLTRADAASPSRATRGLQHRFAEETLEFDGRTAITESNEPVRLCAGNKTWTISFWFRPAGDEDGAIFSSVEEPERYRPGIQADWVDGRVRVRHVCRWVNSYIEFVSVERLEPGRWHHVTFRCDGRMQGPAYRASLNGDDAAMRCTHPVTNDSAAGAGKAPLVLGGSPLTPNFVGSLRDLRFYDRVLEPGEIASLADPRSTAEIARIPIAERTDREAGTLRLAFLESESLPGEVAALQEEMFAATAAYEAAVKALPTTMVMQEADRGATRVRRMGVYDQLGDAVSCDTPSFLPPLDSETPTRLEFARWLTAPEHPLTARVAVNRIWQQLWGRGFVESPENFGMQCPKPLHADLLDWLAVEYVRSGWDTKALIRLIVTSRAYRQRSAAPVELWQRDPENRLLARGPRFRLPVQVVRDQALLLSGRLDRTLGGPPVVLDEVQGKDGKPVALPYETTDRRRTLYTFWKRNAPHPMLAVFDVADRNQCDVRVRRTNTPLQALVTLNERGLAACAGDLGKRARREATTEPEQLRWLWLACTGRTPTDHQLQRLAETLASYRQTAANDAAEDNAEEAAWLALCNVLLNLDATLTLE